MSACEWSWVDCRSPPTTVWILSLPVCRLLHHPISLLFPSRYCTLLVEQLRQWIETGKKAQSAGLWCRSHLPVAVAAGGTEWGSGDWPGGLAELAEQQRYIRSAGESSRGLSDGQGLRDAD